MAKVNNAIDFANKETRYGELYSKNNASNKVDLSLADANKVIDILTSSITN